MHKTPADLDVEDRGSGEGEKGPSPTSGSSPDIDRRLTASGNLERYINLASVVNFAFLVLASWQSFAVTFQFGLVNGGPASIFYGSFLAGIGCCLVGFSLAELASMSVSQGLMSLCPPNNRMVIQQSVLSIDGRPIWLQLPLVSGVCSKVCLVPFMLPSHSLTQCVGWITLGAWCFACSGPPSIIANMITSMASFNNPTYVVERWHTSLIMIGAMIIPFIFNLWFRQLLNSFEMFGGILYFILFIIFLVILIVFGPKNSNDFVFKTLVWEVSGWNNKGVSWGLGLLSMSFSVCGADSVLHMCDEVKKVRTRVPRSIVLTCIVNAISLVIFATVLLFYMGPLTSEVTNSSLPILLILANITKSGVCANILVSCLAIMIFLSLFNYFASVSRLIWVFARDNGLPFSPFFAYIHPTLKLPVNALALIGIIVACLSLIYIASATAFNALVSLQALGLHVSYFFPILFILIRKLRGPPPPYGPWRIGKLGIPVNIGALLYLVFVIIWMPFPQILPVTKDNMNYSGPIFGAVVVGGLIHWFAKGKKTFKMPVVRYE